MGRSWWCGASCSTWSTRCRRARGLPFRHQFRSVPVRDAGTAGVTDRWQASADRAKIISLLRPASSDLCLGFRPADLMIRASTFSWKSVHWTRVLFSGGGTGVVLGFLVGSAAFRWGPASALGTVFIALLAQPPLVGLLLVAGTLIGGMLLGRQRPLKGDGLRASRSWDPR